MKNDERQLHFKNEKVEIWYPEIIERTVRHSIVIIINCINDFCPYYKKWPARSNNTDSIIEHVIKKKKKITLFLFGYVENEYRNNQFIFFFLCYSCIASGSGKRKLRRYTMDGNAQRAYDQVYKKARRKCKTRTRITLALNRVFFFYPDIYIYICIIIVVPRTKFR